VQKLWAILLCFLFFYAVQILCFCRTLRGILNFLVLFTIGFFCRILPSVAIAAYAVKTTTVSELISGMERIHMPKEVTIPLTVMFRFLNKFPCVYGEIDISNPSAAGFFTIRKRNILKIYHGKIPPAEIIGEAIAQNTTKQQNKISTTSAKLNLSWQMFVRLTGAPRPRVIAAAESSSPIFTEQVIIGISLYSNIFEDCFFFLW